MSKVLVLVGAGATIWWRASHEKWDLVRTVVFWVALLAVLWVLLNWYSVPQPNGLVRDRTSGA